MTTFYFDWSAGKIDYVKDDRGQPKICNTLWDLLDLAKPGDTLIGEATFESFLLSARNRFINDCAAKGVTLLTTPNRATGRVRHALYPQYDNKPLPDDLAAQIIRDVAKRVHLKAPRPFDPEDSWVPRREAANHRLMILRSTKYRPINKRTGEPVKTARSEKEDYAEALIARLPAFDSLTVQQQDLLGNGVEYSKVIVAAAGVATEYARSAREFERLAGLYHHGYPSLIRSDLHLHGWWRAAPGKPRKADRYGISSYRRELRWLYHQLKTVVTPAKIDAVS